MSSNLTTKISFDSDLKDCTEGALVAFIKVNSSTPLQIDIIEKTSKHYTGSLIVFVSEDELDFFAKRFQFSGSPVFILFKYGKEVARFLGMAGFEELSNFIDLNIKSSI